MRAMFPSAPDEADTEVTEDGTACHWLAAEIWNARFQVIDTLAPNGRLLTDEMFDAVDTYHDVLRGWGTPVTCEQPVRINRIMEGMIGTPDAWSYDPVTKTLRIADLKFGFRFVEVWWNWQMICYACGLMDMLNLDPIDTLVEFTIVQPRSYHRDGVVRTWRVFALSLEAKIEELRIAAHAAVNYAPNPGCRDCPGRHVCVALQNSALTALEQSYGGDPCELTPAALGDELRRLKEGIKRMEARVSGLDTQAEALLRAGKIVPGWVLQASYARETWRTGTEGELITLAEHYFKANVLRPPKAITPAQARKVLPASIVAIYAHKPSTGVRLTKVDPLAAQKAFDNQHASPTA